MGVVSFSVLNVEELVIIKKIVNILPEANIIECLIVNTVSFICILDKLVDGQGGVVWLHHGVGHLGGGDHGVGVHDPVGVLLADLRDEECAHPRSSPSSERVGQLETLEIIVI